MDIFNSLVVKSEIEEVVIKVEPEEIIEEHSSLVPINSETNFSTHCINNAIANNEIKVENCDDFNSIEIKLEQEQLIIKDEPEECSSIELMDFDTNPSTYCFRNDGTNNEQDAIPTEFLPNQKQSLSIDKSERCQKQNKIKNRSTMNRKILKKVEDGPNQLECTEQDKKQSPSTSAASMEPSASELTKLIEQLKSENSNLRKQNETLQQNLTSVNTELESIKTMLK